MKQAFPILLKPWRSGAALALAALLLPLSATAKPHHWDKLKPGKDYLADEVVVEVVESQDSILFRRAGKSWKEKVTRAGQTPEAARLMQLAAGLGCTLVKKLGTLPFYEFKIPKGADPTKVCEALESYPEIVKLAEPNGMASLFYAPYSFPNDPYYQDGVTQWNTSITQLDRSWNTASGGMSTWSQGTASVWIGVVDTGINDTHVDLVGQLVTGHSVLDGTTITTDTFGHGTNVAAIASSTTNNGLGIACGAILCKLLPVKAGVNTVIFSDAAAGVDWASNNGAKVINLSIGASSDWAPLRAACDDAYYNFGIALVAGTGNTGSLIVNYPASYPYMIAAGGSTTADQWWTSSSFGTYVICASPTGVETCDIGSSTAYTNSFAGTSQSSPGVAGLCAVLVSNGVPNYECVSRIATTCDKIDAVAHPYGVTTTCGGCLGSWNNRLGYGRINFYRAMETLVAPTLNTGSPGVGSVDLAWSVPPLFDAPISGYNIYRSTTTGGPYTKVNAGLITGTAYNDVSGLGGPLYYVIKAFNTNMLATRASNELSAVPVPPSPTITPTFSLSPTFSATPTSTASPSSTATPTMTPTDTSTATSTATPTCTPSSTITGTWSNTPSSTATPTLTPTFSLSPTFTNTSTVTPTPTATSTALPTADVTATPALEGRLNKVIPYPNPYRGTGKVFFAFPPGGGQVQLQVYTLNGELVTSLQASSQQTQSGLLDWGPGLRLATGIYVLAARIDGKRYFGKLVVIQPSSSGGGFRFPGALGSPTGR